MSKVKVGQFRESANGWGQVCAAGVPGYTVLRFRDGPDDFLTRSHIDYARKHKAIKALRDWLRYTR